MDLSGFSVTLVRSKPTHVWHKGMKQVITALKKLDLFPEWKTPEEILEMTLTCKTVLVMADFLCEHFETLSKTDCLVVGPDCLLECLERKTSIPDNGSAVYNLAMADLVITSTNMPKKDKEEVKKYVGWMGGCYTSTFTLAHTHLVANTVNSEKCHAAAEKRKPIMRPEWVRRVWEASLQDLKLRGDSEDLTSPHRLPPLSGLEITLSNLNSALKRKYKKIIEENGGSCVGSLTQKVTHYVITDKCEGEKVRSALAWGSVHVVTPLWLEGSVEAGGPLPPLPFSFKQRPTCSTPTSELTSFMSGVDISAVGANCTAGSERIEETLNSTAQSAASYAPVRKPAPEKPTRPVVPPSPALRPTDPPTPHCDKYKEMVEELKAEDVSRAGCFLDGCKIYLSGWSGSEEEKLRRLLIKAGATVLAQVQRGVTHTVAARLPPDHEALADSGCSVVSLDWVVSSMQRRLPLPVSGFLLNYKPPPPSPLSSKGLELLKSKGICSQNKGDKTDVGDHTFQPPVSRKLFEKTPKKKLQLNEVCDLTASEGEGSDGVALGADCPPDRETTSTNSSQMSETTNMTIFQGLVLTVLGFDASNAADIVAAIEGQGGSVVPQNFQGVPDYAVLPIEGVSYKFTATEVVNALWIEECLDTGRLVEVEYYHQPISIRAPGVPLSSAIICLSGFPQKEKLFLFNLATILGAQVQEAFSRKDNPGRGVLRSTHLVSSEACGSKYEAAIKWGVPVVSKAWLTEAAANSAESQPPPHQPYSLTKLQPNQDNIETTPLNTKSSKSNCSATPVNKTGSQLPKTSCSQLGSARHRQVSQQENQLDPTTETDRPDEVLPPATTPDLPAPDLEREDPIPETTRTVSLNKGSRASSSMFPTLGADDLSKFNVSLNSPANTSALKRRSGDKSPLREQNSPATPLFQTPLNHLSKIARLSENSLGKSPFHVDTPDTPLGKVFYSNPDKKTSKLYKKFIDSFPDFKQETPIRLNQASKSPPLDVLRKQILAQLGGKVDGIETGTGKLLKNGIYSEWASSSAETSLDCAAGISGDGNKMNELMALMAQIQEKDPSGATEDSAEPGMERKIEERLQAASLHHHLDIRSHPLYKIRPNAEALVDAERPSTSSVDKADRNKMRKEASVCRAADQSSEQQEASVCRAADQSSQQQESQAGDDGTPTQPVPKRFFMLSSLPVEWKEKYEGLIRGLGGEVLSSGWYQEESTHLVIETPVRNEKLLCCIASGKWILHTSYLDQCYERRSFIPEDEYEWGNPLSESRLPRLEPGSSKHELAKAAYRWRTNCCNIKQRAFRQMKVTLICREQSKAMFTRLLRAGGAHIIDDSSKCNICLVEEGKVEVEKGLLESLASRSVPCVPLIYLNAYLVHHPNIDPTDHLIDQYIPIFNNRQLPS